MTNARAVRYRRLAMVEPDAERAATLQLIADEAERGVLCVSSTSMQKAPLIHISDQVKDSPS